MKKLLVLGIFFFSCNLALAEELSIYDYQTGKVKNYHIFTPANPAPTYNTPAPFIYEPMQPRRSYDFSAPFRAYIEGQEQGQQIEQEEILQRLLEQQFSEPYRENNKSVDKTIPPPPPPPSYFYSYDQQGSWSGFEVWDKIRKEYVSFPFNKTEKDQLNRCRYALREKYLSGVDKKNPTDRLKAYDDYGKALLDTPCQKDEEKIKKVIETIVHSYQGQEEKTKDIFDKIQP